MTHRYRLRAEFTRAATEMLLTWELPYDIIHIILRTCDYAADVIRRMALDMKSAMRTMRMSIRWFFADIGLPEPLIVRGRGWYWVHPSDDDMTALEELTVHVSWQLAGRPVPPYVHVFHSEHPGDIAEIGVPCKSVLFSSIICRTASVWSTSVL